MALRPSRVCLAARRMVLADRGGSGKPATGSGTSTLTSLFMDLTLAGAFATGLVTSVHCAGMCGPLACGLGSAARTEQARLAAICSYHTGRMTAYASIGAVCGALGKEPLGWFFHSPAVILPWLLVIALLMSATRLDKRLPYPQALLRFTARLRFKAATMPAVAGG